MIRQGILLVLAAALPAAPASSQHARVTSVAANPGLPSEIWACNRANDSVSVVDASSGAVTEVPVGVWPRSIAFSADGSTAFVANQRGNVPVTTHFVTPFTGSELRGTISVVDVASRTVTQTLTQVGTEPYGLAVAPSGAWFAVTGFQSGTVKFYDTTAPYALLATFQYDHTLNHIGGGKTVLDVDSNGDFLADLAEPRAFVIRSDNLRMYVTHSVTGFVSVLDLTLDGNGKVSAAALSEKIDLNTYPFHPIFNPQPVQDLQSQGVPRFLDDIALSPDGTRAIVPHLLHNVNHDVNHDFGPMLAGDFANRVYPALSIVDAVANSYAGPGDASGRLHHELGDTPTPAEHIPYGGQGIQHAGGILTLGGLGSPLLGGTADYVIAGTQAGDMHWLAYSDVPLQIPVGPFGTVLNDFTYTFFAGGPSASLPVPNNPLLDGLSFYFQGVVFDSANAPIGLTNGVETVLGTEGFGPNKMGYRAGHPGRVLFNAAGDRALLLNRGSEDLFLYEVAGSDFELMTVFPPRHGFVPRAPLDLSTPLGDLPLGMALVEDPSTTNDDALLYVINETSRSLSRLRVDWVTGAISQEAPQVATVQGPDAMTLSQQLGQELFEDASRPQTAGNFNNSCASCHFEGGADGNVWQRPAGPRSTMPVYGGSLLTGLILWKGVRLNMGETGPMFGGENGGTGLMSDSEQQALIDYHNIVPVPLNPNLDPVTGAYSTLAAEGKDLFFGTNDSGLNPSGRDAGCAACHPDQDLFGDPRGYTADFLNPLLTSGENLGSLDPNCFSLRPNIVAANIRNVNSGVNIDFDPNSMMLYDRNNDGIADEETYVPMNADADDDFTRDDTNSYMCPDPGGPGGLRLFARPAEDFSIPTKLGVFSTGPYFHDHSVSSLRILLDPAAQQTDPVYGDAGFPGLNKFLNEFHDVRGDGSVVPNSSKVQLTLMTASSTNTIEDDIEALLAYIESL